jgi:hypothetical protein
MFRQIGIEEALEIHLQYNHYPPVTTLMVEPCKQAIEYCNSGSPDQNILCGDTLIPAWKIVEDLHLGEWLIGEDE